MHTYTATKEFDNTQPRLDTWVVLPHAWWKAVSTGGLYKQTCQPAANTGDRLHLTELTPPEATSLADSNKRKSGDVWLLKRLYQLSD